MVPFEFLRGILGILCLFFAHMAGRAAWNVARGYQKTSRLYGWIIRATVCGGAMLFRHELDTAVIGVLVLALVAAGAGWWAQTRAKPEEDLTHEIFPDQK